MPFSLKWNLPEKFSTSLKQWICVVALNISLSENWPFIETHVQNSSKAYFSFLIMWIYIKEMKKSTSVLPNKKVSSFPVLGSFSECCFKGHYSLWFTRLLKLKSVDKLLDLKYVRIKLLQNITLKTEPILLRTL